MEPQDSLNKPHEPEPSKPWGIPKSLVASAVLPNVHPCSYLPDQTADLPLVMPAALVPPTGLDDLLNHGMRRAGYFFYYVDCPRCRECQPTRIRVKDFRWSDSWRRIRNRGDKQITVSLEEPLATEEKIELFNKHRDERCLGDAAGQYGKADYESFLVESSCQWTAELQFRIDTQLVAVSVIDCGATSVSAVYTYFDPKCSAYSLGTYSILKQIEFCMQSSREFLYLGMYVKENSHLNYKARFLPQQRWIDQKWVDIPTQQNAT